MNRLTLYNTLAEEKEIFSPRHGNLVTLFTCGPSVYRRQHLGNYRTYLFEDILHRFLIHQGFEVKRVINFTDIEDKAIEEAEVNGMSVTSLRRPVEEAFFAECEQLGIQLPEAVPRATTSVASAVDLIRRLMDRGHAYRHKGSVYFDPLTYEGFGRLYGLDMSNWPEKRVRFHRDTYPGHRWNRGDFILWHACDRADGEVCWDTEIGRGRPAWNIQDAAMIAENLGFEIDIHTGGIDNLYRHHDYTLAVMEAASGKRFCPWWLHGGHLLVDGRKMSKSKGNVTYVEDLLQKGFEPEHIRFFLLYGPYRETLDLRISRLDAAAGKLDRVRRLAKKLCARPAPKERTSGQDPSIAMRQEFEEAMNDNLDFAGAFDAVTRHLERAEAIDQSEGLSQPAREAVRRALENLDRVMGVLGETAS